MLASVESSFFVGEFPPKEKNGGRKDPGSDA